MPGVFPCGHRRGNGISELPSSSTPYSEFRELQAELCFKEGPFRAMCCAGGTQAWHSSVHRKWIKRPCLGSPGIQSEPESEERPL